MQPVELKKNIHWIGATDAALRTFDIIMETEFGTTYNAYIIKGEEKTALIETVKAGFADGYCAALEALGQLGGIDYLVVNHTEPDHTGSIERLLSMNPSLTIVGTMAAIRFVSKIINRSFNSMIVKEGDSLSLGGKTLEFHPFPNLHWPDTMLTYIPEDGILFTCDAFGAHYASESVLLSRITEKAPYREALRYYFDHILRPFRQPYMQKALDFTKALRPQMICPGHGPVLDTELDALYAQYAQWCAVPAKANKLVVIPYVSAYGYTGQLAEEIARALGDVGGIDVHSYDMVVANPGQVLEDIEGADGLLLGSPTILGDALQPIWSLLSAMTPYTYGGKRASAFGSYGWSGEAVPNLLARMRQLRMKVEDEGFRAKLKPNAAELEAAYAYGRQFGEALN